jgi:hypothetical protein
MQVSFVIMSCPSPWLHPVCCYKRSLKAEKGRFGLLPFGALPWALDFLLWGTFCLGILERSFYFGPFDVGSFWKGKELLKGKISEGKRIIEGKMLKRD